MRPALAGVAAALMALSAAGLASPACAAKPAWDQPANVKDAAERLAKLQRASGADAVLKFLDACYRTHTLADKFTAGLEACMAQDYMHSKVLALIYAKVPAETRAQQKLPAPEAIAQAMGQRFGAIFRQYKLSPGDAEKFRQAVDTHGMPVFLQAAFPESAAPAAKQK